MDNVVIQITEQPIAVVTVPGGSVVTVPSNRGATVITAGQQGPPGPPGQNASGAVEFLYAQANPSALWTIQHNLNTYPAVTVVDSAGNLVFGSVVYLSLNICTVEFSSAFAGDARLI